MTQHEIGSNRMPVGLIEMNEFNNDTTINEC